MYVNSYPHEFGPMYVCEGLSRVLRTLVLFCCLYLMHHKAVKYVTAATVHEHTGLKVVGKIQLYPKN